MTRAIHSGPLTFLAAFLAAACGLARPAILDLPPGQRVVLGRIDLRLYPASEILLDIARDDGTFQYELYVGLGPHDFAIGLPPGRYIVHEVRRVDQREGLPQDPIRYLAVVFDVGADPAGYVGTLQLISTGGSRVRAAVVDDYATTVPALRARYRDIPAEVVRSLFRPA